MRHNGSHPPGLHGWCAVSGSAVTGGLLLAVLWWASWRFDRRGRSRARGAKVAAAAGAPVVRLHPTAPKHPVRAVLVRAVVRSVHAWPIASAVVFGPAGLVALLVPLSWLTFHGVTWWAATVVGLVLGGPGLGLAVWALLVWSRRRNLDPWAAVWSRLADDVVQDGKVVTRAVLPRSRVLGRPTYDRDPETGVLRRVGLRVRGHGPHQTLTEFRAKAGAVAAAYVVPDTCVEVAQGGHNGEALVWVTTGEWMAHLQQVRADRMSTVWPLRAQVLDRATGLAEVAVQLDNGRPAVWETFRPGVGSRHGVVGGDTRYGKSTFVETLTVVQCRSGLVVPVFVDLAGGVTFEPWRDRVQLFADNVRDAEALMARVDTIYEERIEQMKRLGWRGVWRYSEQDPAIVMKIDEGPELKASKKASALLSRAVRLYGKAGIGVEFASQSLTIESILGREAGSAAKSQMMAGNLAAFYSNQGLAGLPFDGSDVPMVAGVCKLYGPPHPQAVLVRGLLAYQHDVDTVDVPTMRLPAAPAARPAPADEDGDEVAAWGPGTPYPAPLHLVPDPDPEERIRDVLAAAPEGLTTAEVVAATRLGKTKVYALLPRMRGVVKDVNYGGRWSLVKE